MTPRDDQRPDTREQEELVRDQLYGSGSRVGGDDIPPPEDGVPVDEGAPAEDGQPAGDGPSSEDGRLADDGPSSEEAAPPESVPAPETFAGRLGRDAPGEDVDAPPVAPSASADETVEADVLGDTAEEELAAEVAAATEAAEEAAAEPEEADAEPEEAAAEPEVAAEPAEAKPEEAAAEPEADAAVAPAEAPTEVRPEAEPAPTVAAEPVAAATGDGAAGAPPGADDAKPPKAGLWPRFLAASLLIVISVGAATATSILLYLTDIAKGLGGLPGVQSELAHLDGGDPQTILILGSDVRPDLGEERGRSDTTMLVRLDADRGILSLLSLPRDLKVNIPGHGIGRLNEAYTVGGPKLTLETVKDLTGLEIHHLVNVDFAGFAKAVDAIGCVYIDVDRDYFHSNAGLPPELQYSEINIDAGYQRLCGPDALAYVRYRHEDNDVVRAARQQDFLREARARVSPQALWEDRKDLINIFTDYVTSDIEDPVAMLEVLKLFIELRNAPVQKIDFDAKIGGPDAIYVTASDAELKEAVNKFLGEKPPPSEAPVSGPGGQDTGGSGGGAGGGDEGATGEGAQMIDASEDAEAYGLKFDEDVHFPVYAPTQLPPGSTYDDDSHTYGIDTPDETYGAYKLVMQRTGPYGVPEYFGVMGTRWHDPPILEDPSETREIDGREYLLFYEGDRLRTVGWKTDEASYWVSNTLTRSLEEGEMLAIARSLRAYSPGQ